MKFTIAVTRYVGNSDALLQAQHHEVLAIDVVPKGAQAKK